MPGLTPRNTHPDSSSQGRMLGPHYRLALLLVLLVSPAVMAQHAPADAAKQDATALLRQWLNETAAAGPTSFEVRWQPRVQAMGAGVRPPDVQAANGTFARDLLLVQTEGESPRTLLQVGRHCLVREHGGDWAYARTMQEGTDPPLLLRALAAELTNVAARSIVERDGAAFEQVTLCLTGAQAARLVDVGAIVETSNAKSLLALVKSGRLAEDQVPVPIVDVCLDVDVATHRIHRFRLRAVSEALDVREILRKPPGRGPAGAAEVEAVEQPAPSAPLQCEDGLPVRDVKGKQVVWIDMLLRDHGKAPDVVLDATLRSLLGR